MFQAGKYDSITTPYTTKIEYYVIKFLLEAYTLQEDTTYDRQINTAGKIFFKTQYMTYMQYYTKWHWKKSQQQNNNIVRICTFVHPCLDLMAVTEVKQIPNTLYSRNQSRKAFQGRPIFLTDSDHVLT